MLAARVFAVSAVLLLPVLSACTMAPADAADPTAVDEQALALPADGGVPSIQLPKCVAGPFTSSGFGNACPNRNDVATALCSLGSFSGGRATSFNCSPIPGSIPQQYDYTITYECFRPQPCR